MRKIFEFIDILSDLLVAAFFLYLFYLSFVGQPACVQMKDLTFGVCREGHEKIKDAQPTTTKFETAVKSTF